MDAIAWGPDTYADSIGIYYEERKPGEVIAGGMGGGLVTDSLWIHKRFIELNLLEEIGEIISGKRMRLTNRFVERSSPK